jgi:hypothetical protein
MRTKINRRTRRLSCASLLAAMPLLASCAGSGLYYMSDDWCARHIEASPAHCPLKQNARNSADSNDVQQIDPQRAGLASR